MNLLPEREETATLDHMSKEDAQRFADFLVATQVLEFHTILVAMEKAGVMLKLRPAKGLDFYAGIEVIFPGKEPIYFSLDEAKDPR